MKKRRYQFLFLILLVILGVLSWDNMDAYLNPTLTPIQPQGGPTVPPTARTEPATELVSTALFPNTQTTDNAVPTSAAASNEVKALFIYDYNLYETEHIEVIEIFMGDVEGISAVLSSKIDVVITYNPDLISIEDIQRAFDEIGFTVHLPGD